MEGFVKKLVSEAVLALIAGLFVSCTSLVPAASSAPKLDFSLFQDNQAYRSKFTGTWTEDTVNSGIYDVFEFRNDGTGFYTYYSDNKVYETTSIQYKLSDYQIMIRSTDFVNTNRANYTFTDNNTLSLVSWHNGQSNGTYNRSGTDTANITGVEEALARAAEEVSENFTARSRIAIVYITAEDRSQTDFIAGELEHILRRRGFVMVDRSELDRIRVEQQFGTTFEVDDNTAARIGHIAGASIVITGRVDGEGNLRRLRLRALDTTSALVVGTASERL